MSFARQTVFKSRLRYVGFLDNGIGFTVQTDLKNMLLDIMLDDEKILIRLRKIDNKESSIDYKKPPIANIEPPKTKLDWIEIGGIAAYIILAIAYLGISFLEWI